MEKNVEKALDSFIETPVSEDEKGVKGETVKKVVIEERDGLIIERIDKVFVTKEGKQLLREVY
jgi:hypothetical protein